jgi:hypothetical protein
MTGGDPKIDFAEEQWNWGEILPDSVIQLVGDKVATVLWDQITEDMNQPWRTAHISFDDKSGGGVEGEPVLVACLLETHHLVIPLAEIEIDNEMMVILSGADHSVDFDATITRLKETRAVFEGWIAEIDKRIAETEEEQAKP